MKKLIMAILVALLIIPVSTVAADDYSYDVTVYTGDQGQFEDGSTSRKITVDPGSELVISFDSDTNVITVNGTNYVLQMKDTDSKYSAIGFKRTGYDNKQFIASYKGTVNEDLSFVVTYGISGSLIEYKVIYQTDSGTVLGTSVYKGKVDDKPIVAALPFDGYLPDAYNRTRTLKEGEDNTFTFIYHPAGSTTETVEETEYITLDDGTVVPATTGGNNTAAPAAGNTETVEPVEIIDEDVPLAGPSVSDTSEQAAGIDNPEASVPEFAAHATPFNLILVVAGILSLLIQLMFIILAERKTVEEE